MPQPFPQPRHPDDTPDSTPMVDIDGNRVTFVRLNPDNDDTDSPLRRALRRARLRAPFGIGKPPTTPDQPAQDPRTDTQET